MYSKYIQEVDEKYNEELYLIDKRYLEEMVSESKLTRNEMYYILKIPCTNDILKTVITKMLPDTDDAKILTKILTHMVDAYEEGIFRDLIVQWLMEIKPFKLKKDCGFYATDLIHKNKKYLKIYTLHPDYILLIDNCWINDWMVDYYERYKPKMYEIQICGRKYIRQVEFKDGIYFINRVGRGRHILTTPELEACGIE